MIKKAGATSKIIAPKVGGVKLSDGSMVKADGQLAGMPSQLFDAVALIVSKDAAQKLLPQAAVLQWLMDAFGHLKAIGSNPESAPLLAKAHIEKDKGVTDLTDAFITAAGQRFWDREAKLRDLA